MSKLLLLTELWELGEVEKGYHARYNSTAKVGPAGTATKLCTLHMHRQMGSNLLSCVFVCNCSGYIELACDQEQKEGNEVEGGMESE